MGLAIGWGVMAFGLWTLFRRSGATRPPNFGALFVGLALVHDLALAPLVTAFAAWVVPRLPAPARGVVIGAAIVSAALVLVSLPPILGAQPRDNPSLLPRDYPLGLVIALAAVWTAAAVGVALVRLRRAR
jgi:ABC-type iron transport system FetAB permease component